ncbi:hypothetical protein K431DRAFT_282636 [Polychaeton citri CBS 116435]|uniref:Uncharacterized protein n=1 Tax=Polychaeton citri CBS 116435 TaxID=1314669 RepID=A0A9P4QCL9_9PEZI|nr:hypothetical protein K431DRAFT_282636 [Polychaeton citri CBS 116435]
MPPRASLSGPLRGWQCAKCRTYCNTARFQTHGPESPRYMPVPDPPQSTIPDRPSVKGVLPVPRDIFAGSRGKDLSDPAEIAKATPLPKHQKEPKKGSREEWKAKLAVQRRQNLREGITALRARKTKTETALSQRGLRRQKENFRLAHAPEREDERLTAPSHGLDLDALYHGGLRDPTRAQRLETKRDNYARHQELKREARMDDLHTLYTNARHFIVSNQQLEDAIDAAFGTPAQPITFGRGSSDPILRGFGSRNEPNHSIWAHGRPETVAEMAKTAEGGKGVSGDAIGMASVNRERVRKIGEMLTGGKMVDPEDDDVYLREKEEMERRREGRR